jgi:polar amino acid transport system substrate-binding protein
MTSKSLRNGIVIGAVLALALTGCTKKTEAKATITFGVDATYAPNEYKDANGKVVGWDIELGDALAAQMGRTPKYVVATFDNIIPGVIGGKYDAGLSSFSDTPERQKQVDFVDYYSAGIQWAAAKGGNVDPNNACGLTVSVENGTTEILDDLPMKSKACTDAGKPAIKLLGFDTQDLASQAVVAGRADAMSADSPITQNLVIESKGKLELVGAPYDVVPYGIVVAKDNTALSSEMQTAFQAIMDNGTYAEILKKWGVEAGAVSSITLNGK